MQQQPPQQQQKASGDTCMYTRSLVYHNVTAQLKTCLSNKTFHRYRPATQLISSQNALGEGSPDPQERMTVCQISVSLRGKCDFTNHVLTCTQKIPLALRTNTVWQVTISICECQVKKVLV